MYRNTHITQGNISHLNDTKKNRFYAYGFDMALVLEDEGKLWNEMLFFIYEYKPFNARGKIV